MSEFCQNCEGYYDTVFRVPDDVWEKLTDRADGRGLLCPACCDLLARRAGLELYWEAAVGEYPVAAEREACCTLDPPPLTDEQEDEWLYKHNGRYADAFWDGWEAYHAAIRARAREKTE